MNKLYYTKKILNKTILNEDVIEIITNELIENDRRFNDINYLKKKVITFGKHRDKTYEYLIQHHPRYCNWIIKNNINPHKNMNNVLMKYMYEKTKKYRNFYYKKQCIIYD